jgi:hypothetical protein
MRLNKGGVEAGTPVAIPGPNDSNDKPGHSVRPPPRCRPAYIYLRLVGTACVRANWWCASGKCGGSQRLTEQACIAVLRRRW